MGSVSGLKKFSEVERVPGWIVNECDRWRLAQMRAGHFPNRAELEAHRRELEARGRARIVAQNGYTELITFLESPEALYSIDPDAVVYPPHVPIGYAYAENGCCSGRLVVITQNERPDGTMNYSAQCACDGWCTTGCDTPEKALEHYERMSAGENLYGGAFRFEF